MLWLSNDSNTSCSRRRHHRPRSSSSSSSSASSRGVSYFLGGTASWRTRRQQTTVSSAIGVLPSSTVLVRTLLFCSIVVMIVRCEQSPAASSLAAGRPNGSDWKSLIRHSFVNQTGSRGGRWHPPARPSPALSPLSLGRARHRHQPYLPWFDSSHTSLNSPHGSHEDRQFGLLATSDETTSVLRDPLAKIVLPRQTVSNPGATLDLPHNAITLNSQSENDGDPKDTADTTSMSSLRLAGAKVVAGMNFTLTRRLRKNEFVGNLVRDKNLSAHPSQTLLRQQECLILDSYVISHVCSQSHLSVDGLNFQFCTHLRVAGAINPDWPRQLKDNVTEEECRQNLTDLHYKDEEAHSMYKKFDDVLSKYDCEDPYSTEWNCTDCKLAYKHWVCSATIPHYSNKEAADPCSHYSEMVENRCPYLSPHSQYQYAGEPVFLSTQSRTSSKEMKLRSCHFLCQDRSVNPQTENSYASYSQFPGDCNTADLCFLQEEDDGQMELMQANESNFSPTFPLEVSTERDRQTGPPDETLQPADNSRTFFKPEIGSEESQTGVITSLMRNSSPPESKLTSLGILCIHLLVNHIVLL